jgi:RimJ/RimL family protein N-acetyltransferase
MRDKNELICDLLSGKSVRLAAENAEEVAPLYVRWAQDAEYTRLLEGGPPIPFSIKATRELTEKEWPDDDPNNIMFSIRLLGDDRVIGFANLDYISWHNGDTYMGIGIGEKAYRGKGYGLDAMNTLLRYAFTELSLFRVTLTVFEYNQQAIHLYEKAGFRVEGRHREYLYREGRRWDLIEMGILREEWLERNGYET